MSWFIKDCLSENQAEEICKKRAVGGFIIWPNPTAKKDFIYSYKRFDGTIKHLPITKEDNGYKIEGENKTYSSIELVILGARNSVRQEIVPNDEITQNNEINGNTNKLNKEQEEIVNEIKEMFPSVDRDRIIRATTLANGEKSKIIDLLLSQKIENFEDKQQNLTNALITVIHDSKKKLVGYNKFVNNVKKLSEVTSDTSKQLVNNLNQIKKLLQNVNGPEVEQKPVPNGETPVAKIQRFKRIGIDGLKEVIPKLNIISKEIKEGKAPLNQLLVYGGMMRNVKLVCDSLDIDENGLTPKQRSKTEDNYIIDSSDLELGDVIGEGSYGKVFKAIYTDPVSKVSRQVAVKSLAGLKGEKEKNWVKREINLLKQVKHPNVTEFIGISRSEEGHMLIVMELVSGGELYKKLLDEKLEISWDLRFKIALDVAGALAYMHKRKIIHRDIKSENLLVDDEWNCKICDFGFARAIDNRERSRMTVCGSPYFNAPEILLSKAYNDKVDVFAYGILLIEIITRGKVSLDRLGKSSDNAFALDVESITRDIPKDCPNILWKVALCCCNYEPEKRPTMIQVEKMVAACRNLLNQN